MITLTHNDIMVAASTVSSVIPYGAKLYGVPRGGIPAAYAVAMMTPGVDIVEVPEKATHIIDDIEDSGATRARFNHDFPALPFLPLFVKKRDFPGAWVTFPWEDSTLGSASDIPIRLLQLIGEDVSRGGLHDTPARFVKAWRDYTTGYSQNPQDILKTFEDGAENYDQMIVVRDIPVYSHCEHHLAPFFGKAHIAYIPNGRILGLSKFARLADVFARRLQVQERLTSQIAHALNDALKPTGVGVLIECRHMCMEARGVRAPGTTTITSCLLGAIRDEASARSEFMRLAHD